MHGIPSYVSLNHGARTLSFAIALITAALIGFVSRPLVAQDTAADDVELLVSPVALYPDPMLVLVLQGSTQPLQLVEAQQFLDDYKNDPKLTPNPDWDPAVIGLLNYPSVLGTMNENIDWTESLGDAVLDELDDVQLAVQDIRWSSYNVGILKANEHQKVIVDGDIVRIEPADGKKMSIPRYDPIALLDALEPPPEEVIEELEIPEEEAAEQAATEPEPEAEPAPAEAPAETAYAEPAATYAAAPAYDPYAVPAMAPYAPMYAAPPMAYEDTDSDFWGTAATFAGGAAVGGLLGYGIGDDWFDDDDDNNGGGGGHGHNKDRVNIEDSTIIVSDGDRWKNGNRHNNDDVRKELRKRQKDGNRDRIDRKQANKGKDVKLPNAGKPKPKRDIQQPKRKQTAAAGHRKPQSTKKGMGNQVSKRSDVKKAKSRGTASRQKAAKPRASAPKQTVKKPQKQHMAAHSGSGKQARKSSNRGKQSRGNKGGGGRKRK